MYILYIPGKPNAKQRPRLGQSGRGGTSHWYSPEDTNGFAERVQIVARANHVEVIKGGARVGISVDRKMPKSWSQAKQKRMDQGPAIGWLKPDLDNIEKSCLDALTGIAWEDDSQIVQLEIDRSWAYEDAVVINIEEI